MHRKRRRYSPSEKVEILKRHLVNGEAVSDICDDIGLSPNVFYKWQKMFFEQGSQVFERKPKNRRDRLEKEVSDLKKDITEKESVISELVTELIKSKKNIGRR